MYGCKQALKFLTMTLPRTRFFLAIVLILLITLFTGKIVWLWDTEETTGVFYYQTKGNALEQFRLINSICYFKKGNDTIWFESPGRLSEKEGSSIVVRYHRNQPTDARVFSFRGFWGGPIVYGSILLSVILVAYLNKGVFPKGTTIKIFNKTLILIK